jgi:PAS domain S-box-containing protein
MDSENIKILAIDDNPDNLITIKALLNESFEDYEVITALSGIEGLEVATDEKPDVILLDIVMPDMDGFEVCTKLKENIVLQDIPVVFVTAIKGDKESRIKGLDVGADAFLAKPIDESELIAQVRAMVKIRKSNSEKRDENARLSALVSERTRELKSTHVATLNLLEDLRNEIEARKISEEALRESEQKFRDMANLLPQVIFELNLNGEITYVNHQAETLFGYEIDELIGMNSLKIHVPEEHEKVKNSIIQKVNGSQIDNREFIMLRKDGSVFPALIYINSIIKGNQTIGIRGVVIDITEQKKAEEKIRQSEALYKAILDASPDNITITDLQGRILMISPSALTKYGYKSAEEIVGKNVSEFIISEDKERVLRDFTLAAQGIKTGPNEYKSKGTNGIVFDIEVEGGCIPNLNGEIIKLVFISRDITDRKIAQEELEKSEARYREFVENSPEAIAIYSEGVVSYVNKECLRLMRATSKDQLIGMPVIEFIHPDNREIVMKRMQQVSQAEIDVSLAVVEEKYIRLDGTPIFVEVKVMPMLLDNKPSFQLTARDITDRKIVEEALERSRIELKTIYDYAPVMMCVIDEARKIQFANKAFVSLSGMLEENLIGGSVGTVMGCINSTENRHGCGYSTNCKYCNLHKSINSTFRTGKGNNNIEYQSSFVNNGVSHEVSLLGSTAIIRSGNTKNLLLCLVDITDRKHAEAQLLQNNTRLELAMKIANMAWWEINIETGSIKYEKQKAEMLGYLPSKFTHFKDFMAIIHPDDLGKAKKAMKDHIRGLSEKYETEYRVLTSTGDYKYFYDIGSISKRNNNGKPMVISGLVLDITQRKFAEEALQKSEMFLRTFIDNVPFEIWARDVNGIGILENKKLIKHFGSILGQSTNEFSNKSPEIAQLWEENNSRVINGEIIDEEIHYTVDNVDTTFQQIIFPIQNNEEIIGIAGFNIDITPRKKADIALKESQEQLKMFAAHLQSIREEERTLLAREIHDDLGQILVAMKIDMGIMKHRIQKYNKDQEQNDLLVKFDDLLQLVDNTIKTTRRIMTDLRPEVLDMLGFLEAVKQHLKSFQERYKIECQFVKNTSKLELQPQQSVALFRIIQEALNNIAKHAKASMVKIDIEQTTNKLKLEITDNGVGFDDKKNFRIDSYGLIGMKERVFLLDGKLLIKSEPGKGTSIKIDMPL